MQALSWKNGENMPANRDYEVYHQVWESWRVPLYHSHDHYEFYFFIKGSIKIAIEDSVFDVVPYDMFIYPPGYMHSILPLDTKVQSQYERAYFYVSVNFLRRMSDTDYNLMDCINQAVEQKHFHYSLRKDVFYNLLSQMDVIISNADDTHPAVQMMNRCRMNILLASCCQQLTESKPVPGVQSIARIGQIINYINVHLSDPLTLEALSEQFFISKYHLMHEFKGYTNITVHQYILAKRICAAQLLLQEGVSAREAAQRSGFADYTVFYRAFRNKVNMSPQAYAAIMKSAQR